MATVVVEEVVSKYELDADGYQKGAKDVQNAAKKTAEVVDASAVKTKSMFGNVGSSIKSAIGPMSAAKGLLAGIAVAAATALGVLGAEINQAANASKQAASFESLVASIEAIEGSSEKARRAIAKLKDLAKAPGLGVEQAVTGYAGFRRAELPQDLAMKLVAGAGKANALGGGGAEQFSRILLALTQTANKTFLQGEELLQLQEAGVNVNSPLKRAFGTSDTEELKKKGITSRMVLEELAKSFEKLPTKAGGAQNSIDNFMDAIKFGVISFGESINKKLMPQLDGVTDALDAFTKQGGFATVATTLADSFERITGGAFDFKTMLVDGAAAVMTFNSYMEAFITRIKEIGAIIKTIGNLTPSGRIINWVMSNLQGAEGKGLQGTFDSMKDRLTTDMELGRKRADKQAEKDKAADLKDKAKGTNLDPKKPSNILDEIKNNTKATADNTQKQNEITDRVLGGGHLGGRGLSKEEIGMASKKGSRHAPIQQALQNLGLAIDHVMARQTAGAFGTQTTRREI